MRTIAFDELAATLDTTPERLRDLLKQARMRLSQSHYYIFRLDDPGSTAQLTHSRQRTLFAFATPDDALTFSQRNGQGANVRLSTVNAAELLLRLLADPAIEELRVQQLAVDQDVQARQASTRLKRSELIGQLQTPPLAATAAPVSLTAECYDKLQFGVDFTRRAAFRVALAQAIEQIIADYTPPPGSIDQGPRSIFATTEVEYWLQHNGFPHARQRRWISIAGDPAWGGAVELCEIDGGTANHLLIQLVIHADAANRQYIKWVNVTTA